MKEYKSYSKTQYEDVALEFVNNKKVNARYIDCNNWQDNDNELIKALPPIRDKETYFSDFEKVPYWDESMRHKSMEERWQLVSELEKFRIGRTFGYEIDLQVAEALRRGYRLSVKSKSKDAITSDVFCQSFFVKKEGKATAFALIGPSGVGKTTTLMSSLYYYPQVITHSGPDFKMNQITYIKVECPPGGSMKTFYDSCLAELEKALNYEIPDKNRCKTIDAKEQLFKKNAQRWNLGLLVIDEIQNLLVGKNHNLINQFLTLSNELCIHY